MATLEEYKKLQAFLEEWSSSEEFEKLDVGLNEFVQGDWYEEELGPVIYKDGEVEYKVNEPKYWSHHLDRSGGDNITHDVFQFDKDDEYCVGVSGWYDSWNGGETENEFNVYKIGSYTKIIKTFEAVK